MRIRRTEITPKKCTECPKMIPLTNRKGKNLSIYNYHRNQTCSVECAVNRREKKKAKTKLTRDSGVKMRHNKVSLKVNKCDECGDVIPRDETQSRTSHNRKKTCSKACANDMRERAKAVKRGAIPAPKLKLEAIDYFCFGRKFNLNSR